MDNPNTYTFVDNSNRVFNYSTIDNKSNKLIILFTAFFGDWGERAEYREHFQGYFHRYKMFNNVHDYNYLFLCDQYGHDNNGTYYTGYKGDFFVERAIDLIIDKVVHEFSISKENIITLGSSMGGYAALKFAIQKKMMGAIAIHPHIYLDISAKFQNREDHVKYTLPDGDTQSQYNYSYTRKISRLINNEYFHPLPRIFIHSCQDDYGVYNEQVIPFLNEFKALGGQFEFSSLQKGGHGDMSIGKDALLYIFNCFFQHKQLDQSSLLSKLSK